MGLFKRGQTWWMRFTYKGRQIRKSTETEDKKLAERIYHKVLGEIAEGKWFERLPGEEKTFKEMMEKYLIEHSVRNKVQKTHIRDKSLADHLLKSFEDLTLAEITPKLISEYKTKRREEGAAPRTINYELALMSHAFNLAIKEWEWLKENPVSRVSREKVNNIRERWLTFEEEKRLLDASPKWQQELIIFSLETRLRQSEVLNLQWPQADLFGKTITILEQKNKSKDTLPLNERALEILKARAKIRNIKTNHVFYNGNGNRIDARNLLRAFYSAIRKANLESLRWHDLRHTFATRLVQAGVDLYTVQKLGRWKTIQIVTRYAHHYPESLRGGVEILDRLRKEFSTNLAQSNEKGIDHVD
jgi:integrase